MGRAGTWALGLAIAGAAEAGDGAAALRAILDEHVEWILREYPEEASQRGDERYNDRLTDDSPQATSRRAGEVRDRLARLGRIDAGALGEADRLDAALLRYELERGVEGEGYHREQMPVDAMSGPQIWLPQLGERLSFRKEKDYEDYVARLGRVAWSLSNTTAQMRAGMEAGRVPPRVVLSRTVEACRAQAGLAARPETSPFYGPMRARGKEDALASRAREVISGSIGPAFEAFGTFVETEYLPRCRESIGESAGVDGLAGYEHLLRTHTTLPLTAREVHELGLKEVARLRAAMIAVIGETDFPERGTLSGEALFTAFVASVRDDPRFAFHDGDEMLRRYRELGKRVDAELPRLFRVLPRNPWGVRALPEYAARSSPAAYYYPGSLEAGVPGYFMVNTTVLDRRPTCGMVSLLLHEAVPGHHLQGALADELRGSGSGVHRFRSFLGYTAYVEGWALYAEGLGLEMGERPRDAGGRGLYENPYDEFGRLSDEMWRACRLVVDTGMHALGWTRERAVAYVMENTALKRSDVESEVDRYIGWPGQACAYKVGQLKVLELRSRAEAALGARFDVRAFHEVVLGGGAVPLGVLEARVEGWIARGGG